jgi:hypothetical protein
MIQLIEVCIINRDDFTVYFRNISCVKFYHGCDEEVVMRVRFNSIFKFIGGEWKCFSIILGIIIIIAGMIVPAGDRLSKTQKLQYQSDLQLKSIGILALSFKTNFHADPRQLSQIVSPGRIDLLPTFYAPNRAERQRPSDWQTNRLDIDLYSDYALPTKTDTAILVFEKPGMWKDGTVAVCMTNLIVTRMRITNFNSLIH